MRHLWKRASVFLSVIILAFGGLCSSAYCNCENGNALPPFLVTGSVDPNLLLFIDNSASMYDLAYINETSDTYCYDDTYLSAQAYEGYFKNSTIYNYSFEDGEFQPLTTATTISEICVNDAANKFRGEDLCIYFNDSSQALITKLAARGNLLNWLAASKMDIEKKILTGGKYDPTHQRLVMESRGCLDRTFVKKVPVMNSSSSFYATLGVRRDNPSYRTVFDVYRITTNGFDNSACEQAIQELKIGNLGQAKFYIDGCMTYFTQTGKDPLTAYKAAFNHAVQGCWYMSETGEALPGAGDITSIRNDCTQVYGNLRAEDVAWPGPTTLTFENASHVCTGDYATGADYIGRCWDPSKAVYFKNGNWTTDGWVDNVDACVEQALLDYCKALTVPEVPDPSDITDITDQLWNIPAMLIEAGVLAQLLDPIATLNGYIHFDAAPTGLLQEYKNRIRMGALAFNNFGSESECAGEDPHVRYYCENPADKDGGRVIAEIGVGTSQDLVNAVNGIEATTWTPFGEAYFNAIGYYTQKWYLRLNLADFPIGLGHDPVEAWCQQNNILIITDGSSTTDLNPAVSYFVSLAGHNDGDAVDVLGCNALAGSTLLDDLTYYAKNGSGIYHVEPFTGGNKQNITTHIVVAGTPRTSLAPGECNPSILLEQAAENGGTSLYRAESISDLGEQLRNVFDIIGSRTSSGSASSVISASRGGEGALYQAIFWPRHETGFESGEEWVTWLGEVHALLIDSYGLMYEDTNGDSTLNAPDERIFLYFDDIRGETRACYDDLAADGSCPGISKGMGQVRYLWSASRWLNSISGSDISSSRTHYISAEKKRYVFTWTDLNNDGIVNGAEVLPFTERDWGALAVSGGRGPVPLDFGVQTSAEVNEIVRWVRGEDQEGMRSRGLLVDLDRDGSSETAVTWRLGDVVHSTPMAAASPAEYYDFLYRDSSYARFARQYKSRRQVIYFGGNDGMLHAVNGGFYHTSENKFCRTESCASEDAAPELGAELWAYVPYNLLAHLKCLTDPAYDHKYFVDLRPRIFDVQIFPTNDGIHQDGWGTILVGGMRFGGAETLPGALDLDQNGIPDYPLDNRKFTSAYFILDITNPEEPPVLLGEFTRTTDVAEAEFGYTTAISTMVPMKEGGNTKWYLILGSGPTTLDGESDQRGKVCALPLDWLVTGSEKPLRMPAALPSATSLVSPEGGCFELPDNNSFVSDLITVDFDIVEDYMADTVYFGTIQGSVGDWGGKLYRLVTREEDAQGTQISTVPSQWSSLLLPLPSPKPNPLPLIDVGQPVMAAPSVGWDGLNTQNFWVFFGTGRFFGQDDKVDNSQQSYYGIKEPVDCNSGDFTWNEVEIAGTHNSTPGEQGLLRVDQIRVHQACNPTDANLTCGDGTTACLPAGVNNFAELTRYIVGRCEPGETGTDGWYKNFSRPRERNLGQATLLFGLLTFTTYQPFDDVCLAEGLSYLYADFYQTGTPWYADIFDDNSVDASGNVVDWKDLGRGLSMTPNLHVGKQEGATAYVQTSTGEIVEIPQPKPPVENVHSKRISWHEVAP